MCDCPAPLVNRVYRGNELVATLVIRHAQDAERHAELAAGWRPWDRWKISCPQCGRVYAEGFTEL